MVVRGEGGPDQHPLDLHLHGQGRVDRRPVDVVRALAMDWLYEALPRKHAASLRSRAYTLTRRQQVTDHLRRKLTGWPKKTKLLFLARCVGLVGHRSEERRVGK